MTQEIVFVIAGAGGALEGRPALIEAETTVADLLSAANLNPEQWQVQVKRQDGLVSLSNQDKLADHVQAGEKVFAVPGPNMMTVGQ